MRPIAPLPLLKRRARLLARRDGIALHAALDRIAKSEGYARWSLLASRSAAAQTSSSTSSHDARLPALLPRLTEGDLLLLGGRPGQGKTLLGLRLLMEAAASGRRAVFFTLEYTEAQTRARLAGLQAGSSRAAEDGVEIVASDDICASTIVAHLAGSNRGTIAVVDYLQILDQDRTKPPLRDQIEVLRRLARTEGFVLAFLSQIDRRFVGGDAALPDMNDIRLPNPVASGVFTKACFVHAGRMSFETVV